MTVGPEIDGGLTTEDSGDSFLEYRIVKSFLLLCIEKIMRTFLDHWINSMNCDMKLIYSYIFLSLNY